MSRFLGASLVLLLACPAAAQDGQAAFDRKDFAAARTAWMAEDTPEAMFGLGLLNDLGLGTPRDTAAALRWYLAAAERGHAEAQFNVAVMLDSGIGMQREPSGAALWYSRAAANGNLRARYNLALLYEAGDGVPRNRDLARAWLTEAGGLAAARERLASLPDDPFARNFTAPSPLGAARRGTGLDVAWTAAPGPRDSRFHVEVLGSKGFAADIETRLSAVWLPDLPEGPLFWRVSRVLDDSYVAGEWQVLGDARAPKGRIRILTGETGRTLADELERAFTASGLVVTRQDAAEPRSGVTHAFRQDDPLARSIAAFLPALDEDDAALVAGRPPGEVTITLAGGES